VGLAMYRWMTAILCVLVACAAPLHGQMPKHPQNLRVLPATLSTDSVFTLMLNVADGLGVTCGYCHVGGDNSTWDSTHFDSDAPPAKRVADALRILELCAAQFPNSAHVAYRLGVEYAVAADTSRAITQFHRALALQPDHRQADRRLRALLNAQRPPPG
jgi:hypothetical protein